MFTYLFLAYLFLSECKLCERRFCFTIWFSVPRTLLSSTNIYSVMADMILKGLSQEEKCLPRHSLLIFTLLVEISCRVLIVRDAVITESERLVDFKIKQVSWDWEMGSLGHDLYGMSAVVCQPKVWLEYLKVKKLENTCEPLLRNYRLHVWLLLEVGCILENVHCDIDYDSKQ